MHLSQSSRGGQRPPLELGYPRVYVYRLQCAKCEMKPSLKKRPAFFEQDRRILTKSEVASLKEEFPEWKIAKRDGIQCLQRVFRFDDFAQALDFTNRVGDLAEEQNHHPMVVIEWGQVTVTWGRVEFGGLHRNDFVMAGKTDQVYRRSSAIRKARQKQDPAQD